MDASPHSEYAGRPQPDVCWPGPSLTSGHVGGDNGSNGGDDDDGGGDGNSPGRVSSPASPRRLMAFLARPAAAVAVLVNEYRWAYAEQAARRGHGPAKDPAPARGPDPRRVRGLTVSGGGAVEYLGRFTPDGRRVAAAPPAPRVAAADGAAAARHDVFISYSSGDQPVADELCAALESGGLRCWIASRDLMPGDDWGAAIVAAIAGCRVMALVLSGHTSGSTHVKREVERAVHHRKVLIPILTEPVSAPPSLEYFISTHQWFDASAGPRRPRFGALATMIRATLAALPCPGACA